MWTYCIAQGAILSILWWPKWEGNSKKRECVYTHTHTHAYIHMADSHSWTAETDKAVQSNYTPIKEKD